MVSSYIKQKFNGFNILVVGYDRKIRKNFIPINIICKPVTKQDDVIKCYFSTETHLAFRSSYNKKEKIEHGNAYQCHFCSHFYVKDRFERHVKNCIGQPGIVCDFNLQNVASFEETLKYKGEIALTAYANFETIAPSEDYQDPENRKMFDVSYVIIFAFHPDLNLERIIVERSFGYSYEELLSIDYLTTDQQ